MDKIKNRQKNKIFSSLYFKCKDLINLINSPSLTDNDKEYFRYKLYNFSSKQINYISREATNQILNYNLIIKKNKKKK